MLTTSSITGIRLDASGLVALADIKTIAYRTVLTGSASFFDVLFIAPGIHCQQEASQVNQGEYPTTGSLTNGYVFRIENQATAAFLQRVGETGHLVNVNVHPPGTHHGNFFGAGVIPSALYLSGIVLTAAVATLLGVVRDWWGLGILGMLMLARLINVTIIKARSKIGWKGAPEPGVDGDLLVLLSQDRWIRMKGKVDDLKAVTAGQWLREENSMESYGSSFATLLVFAAATLSGNVSTIGGVLIAGLLLFSAALLGLCNAWTSRMLMFGRTVETYGEAKRYTRRRDLADELIVASGRDDWAIGMGLITEEEHMRKASV